MVPYLSCEIKGIKANPTPEMCISVSVAKNGNDATAMLSVRPWKALFSETTSGKTVEYRNSERSILLRSVEDTGTARYARNETKL
jgi:hypothetical protein